MKEIIVLAAKDVRLLLRDTTGCFFTFLFPLMIAVFSGYLTSGFLEQGARGIEVAVIDEDRSDSSRLFVQALQRGPELRVRIADRQTAVELVRRGECAAFVVLTAGFGEASEQVLRGEPPVIELGLDPGRVESALVRPIVLKYAFDDLRRAVLDPGRMHVLLRNALAEIEADAKTRPVFEAVAGLLESSLTRFMGRRSETGEGEHAPFDPVTIRSTVVAVKDRPPVNAFEITFPQGIIWGVIGCTATFGVSLVVERTRGTLFRLRMTPVGRAKILAGKAIACAVTSLSMALVLLGVGVVFFHVRPCSVALLAPALVSVALCFSGIVMLLAALGKTEQAANGMAWAILLLLAMLGGGMVPLFFMPRALQMAGHVSPVKWGILALEGAIWRSVTFAEFLVPCCVLLAFGGVCFAVGVCTFRWSSES